MKKKWSLTLPRFRQTCPYCKRTINIGNVKFVGRIVVPKRKREGDNRGRDSISDVDENA